VSESYGWVARYTLAFLDAKLKHDATAAEFLGNPPEKNGVPAHILALDVKSAQGPPATLETFSAELSEKGFAHAAEVYAAFRVRNPDFKLEERL